MSSQSPVVSILRQPGVQAHVIRVVEATAGRRVARNA
jgi:hypothetical protein